MSLSSVAIELSNLVKDNENLIVGSFYERKNIIEFTDIYLVPEDLRYFLTHFFQEGIFYNTNISFTSCDKLRRRQEGYGLNITEKLVFATVNDDPIVIDQNGKIFAAIDAREYKLISQSLESFLKIQLDLCIFDLTNNLIVPDEDEDFEEYISFKEKELFPIYHTIIQKTLDGNTTRNYIDFLWG